MNEKSTNPTHCCNDSDKSDTLLSESELAKLDKLFMSKQIQILEYLYKLLDLKTVTEYSKENIIKRSVIYDKINSAKLPTIKLGSKIFIISNL